MHDFFFSYARAENDRYLQKFFDELSEAVRRQLGKPQDAAVGFFDQRSIERGDRWEDEILTALNQSACVIALYSPSFFNSEFCLREINTFREREELRPRAPGLPGVIIPVEWHPIRSRMVPESFRGIQFRYGDPQSLINKFGVLHSRRQGKKNAYAALLLELAGRVEECVRASAKLPAAPRSAAAAPAVPTAEPQTGAMGPSHVRFVYLAGSDAEQQIIERRAYYGPGANKWRPYHPTVPQAIGPLAQRIAGEQDLTSDELAFDQQLLQAIREAERKRNLVVLIIDGWSVHVETYADALRRLDESSYNNCAVIAPWNSDDALTAQNLAALQANIRAVLSRWSVGGGIRYNDSPLTLPDFHSTLADTLTKLRAQVFNAAQGRPTPFVPRPILTNTITKAA